MSRVLTFSRVYPSYHPKAGQPTYFVEKIFRSQITDEAMSTYYHNMELLRSFGGYDIIRLNLKPLETFEPKYHTIRAGHRWKVGDWFSPRVWSGKNFPNRYYAGMKTLNTEHLNHHRYERRNNEKGH